MPEKHFKEFFWHFDNFVHRREKKVFGTNRGLQWSECSLRSHPEKISLALAVYQLKRAIA